MAHCSEQVPTFRTLTPGTRLLVICTVARSLPSSISLLTPLKHPEVVCGLVNACDRIRHVVNIDVKTIHAISRFPDEIASGIQGDRWFQYRPYGYISERKQLGDMATKLSILCYPDARKALWGTSRTPGRDWPSGFLSKVV